MAVLDVRAWSLAELLVAVIVIAALCAIVYVAVRAMGVEFPAWAVQILWIVVIAAVAILAIRLVLSL